MSTVVGDQAITVDAEARSYKDAVAFGRYEAEQAKGKTSIKKTTDSSQSDPLQCLYRLTYDVDKNGVRKIILGNEDTYIDSNGDSRMVKVQTIISFKDKSLTDEDYAKNLTLGHAGYLATPGIFESMALAQK